jgi:hypothetical protein
MKMNMTQWNRQVTMTEDVDNMVLIEGLPAADDAE